MSITNELRAGGIYGFPSDRRVFTEEELAAIADRIDAEHEAQLNDAFETRNSDENLESDGWVRLPVDADGVPIHIGDVLQWPEDGDTFEVIGIGEDGVLFYFDPDTEGETADWTASQNKRHYHAPTVEDVLTEFGIDWEYEDNCEDRAALLAEYASKLRLAEGEDA